ncbi:MAG: hypothetical protein F6K30_30850 [Cyanothece sp. SIO2G6]|nr:hypothetical protein [Cyanothece sp. SIO2G6]
MPRPAILDKNQSYTFSKYFELTADPEDIFAELDATLQKRALQLPARSDPLDFLPDLETRLLQTLELVDLTSEMARRETLIAPVLLAVCTQARQPLKIEYTIEVNQWLRGTVDYLIPGHQNLLIIEAKQADLARGFVQLGVELLALNEWSASTAPLLYGAVTTGDVWKFGCLQRTNKVLLQDIRLYTIPADLEPLVRILSGIIQ